MSQIDLVGIASVSTPATGETTYYTDSTSKTLKSKNDVGVVTDYAALGNAITSLTGDVVGTGPGAAATSISSPTVTSKLLTGLVPASGTLSAADSILIAFNKLSARLNNSWFPTATDGDIVYSSNFTLVRDVYANSIIVNSSVTVTLAGFRMFALTEIQNNGTIERNGNNASGITAGVGLAAGSLGLGAAGGAGGTAAGLAGTLVSGSLGGPGGAGGSGSGGAGASAGAVTLVASTSGGVEVLQSASRSTLGRDIAGIIIAGGSGGGGGGGDGTAGGGGGGGSGVMVLCSRLIYGTGVISSMGGNGGTPVSGNRGGGGGGGGGVMCLISENDTTATSLTFSVAGGAGSSGTGSGASGSNGSTGRIYRVRV